MARQVIVNLCPYRKTPGIEKACPDFKADRDPQHNSQCKHYFVGNICEHSEPSELLGHALTNEDVNEHVEGRLKKVKIKA